MARRPVDPAVRAAFAKWLKEARIEGGYPTQQSLAEELGVHVRLLQKWEGAEGLPAAENYQAILDVLKLSSGPLGRGFRGERSAEAFAGFEALLPGGSTFERAPAAMLLDTHGGATAAITIAAPEGGDGSALLEAICTWAAREGYVVYRGGHVTEPLDAPPAAAHAAPADHADEAAPGRDAVQAAAEAQQQLQRERGGQRRRRARD